MKRTKFERIERILEGLGKAFLVRLPAAAAIFVLGRTAIGVPASDGAVIVCACAVAFWLVMEWVWAQTKDVADDDGDHPSWW